MHGYSEQSGEDDNLAAGFVFFHDTVGFDDLVELEDAAYLEVEGAGGDLLGEVGERGAHEVFGVAGVDGEVDGGGNGLHGGELIEGPGVADDAGHADDASLAGAAERVLEGGGADEFEDLVDAFGVGLADLVSDGAVIKDDVVGSAGFEQLLAVGVARGGGDVGAEVFGDGSSGEADGGSAAADEEALALLELEGFEEGSPGGLEHLGHGAEDVPGKLGTDALDLRGGWAGVLGVASVELAAEPSHGGGDRFSRLELASGSVFDRADGLDAENARELDVWRMTLASEELRAVEAKGLDADEDLAELRPGNGQGFEP